MCFGKRKSKGKKKDKTLEDPLAERDSSQRISQAEALSQEKLHKDASTEKQTEKSFPCQGNENREPCQSYCNQDRPQSPRTSRAETLTNANPMRISNATQSGNQEQLQILCEMIKMELSSSPDFIYYDAKWRIIEILREVQKRNLIHSKSDPDNRGNDNCNCPIDGVCKNRKQIKVESPRTRIHGPMKATQCPYCCKR